MGLAADTTAVAHHGLVLHLAGYMAHCIFCAVEQVARRVLPANTEGQAESQGSATNDGCEQDVHVKGIREKRSWSKKLHTIFAPASLFSYSLLFVFEDVAFYHLLGLLAQSF